MVSYNAFDRLRLLLKNIKPEVSAPPVKLHLGEQRLHVPSGVLSKLCVDESWSYYPALGGSSGLRQAYEQWLLETFNISNILHKIRFEPTPGTKQAIASTILLSVLRAKMQTSQRPCVAVPEVCYPTYLSAAAIAGADIITYRDDDLPDMNRLKEQIKSRHAKLAAIVVCSPNNPTGYVQCLENMLAFAEFVDFHDAFLLVDECYIDLWLEKPIQSMLQVLGACSKDYPVAVFHTLSKRSAAPGLRSGFVSGHPDIISAYADFNRTCGVSLAPSICEVSAKLWSDKNHIVALRYALYNSWKVANDVLSGLPQYKQASAGFFLWLNVGNGEEVTKKVWKKSAILVMPGLYFCADESAYTEANQYIRISLSQPPSVLRPALTQLYEVITHEKSTVA